MIEITNAIIEGADIREALFGKVKEVSEETFDIAKLSGELGKVLHDFMISKGFEEKEVADYSRIKTKEEDDHWKVTVGAELDFDDLSDLSDALTKCLEENGVDEDSYFEPETSGITSVYIYK